MRLPDTLSSHISKTSGGGDATMSLGRSFQRVVVLTVKKKK